MTIFDNALIRCSALHTIMTNIDSNGLTKGHLTFAKQLHRELRWGRRAQIKSKYIEKGILQEEDAITLLARLKKIVLKKNEERIANSFITGIPDLYLGESIRNADMGYDTKCSWSAETLPYPGDSLDATYVFQNHGYMALTGAKSWTTAFCLVNAPAHQVMTEKLYIQRKYNFSELDSEFIEKCKEVERNMIFDMDQFMRDNPHFDLHNEKWEWDIPKEERVIEFTVLRDENIIDKIYERVKLIRKELLRLDAKYVRELVEN